MVVMRATASNPHVFLKSDVLATTNEHKKIMKINMYT